MSRYRFKDKWHGWEITVVCDGPALDKPALRIHNQSKVNLRSPLEFIDMVESSKDWNTHVPEETLLVDVVVTGIDYREMIGRDRFSKSKRFYGCMYLDAKGDLFSFLSYEIGRPIVKFSLKSGGDIRWRPHVCETSPCNCQEFKKSETNETT